MRILLTNDDGVYAPGLAALYQSLSARHQVTVVAPESEQSAVGHAITLADPIRVRPLRPRSGLTGWAVRGTPADCVKLGLNELMPRPPELVVSGINLGANVGVNVLYSGTVSAATEAAILGLPGLAVSLDTHQPQADFSFAARFIAHLVERLPLPGQPPLVPLNVNVPALPPDQIRGVRFCRQSRARLVEEFIPRQDPRGNTYYWLGGETLGSEGGPETDFVALAQGYITITPIRHDLTHEAALSAMKSFTLELPE
jgi:5'-nucleotidase